MIIKLTYTNALPIGVSLRSNLASAQPLLPQQTLEMVFALEVDENDEAELTLTCEPNP